MANDLNIRRLDPPVDAETDHIPGDPDAEITLVEFGSYACPHCRAAHGRRSRVHAAATGKHGMHIAQIRDPDGADTSVSGSP